MFNNKFLKQDPLVEAVKGAQAEGNLRRQAEKLVNEEFGVYSRKAVIRENLAAYDAALESTYQDLKEGKAKKDWDHDGKIETDKAEVLGSRIRAAKAAGKLEEGDKDPSVQGSGDVSKSAPKEDPSTPKSYPGAASSAPTAQRLSNAKATVTSVKEALKLTPSAPKEFKEKRHPNANAVTKAPVPGVSIAEERKRTASVADAFMSGQKANQRTLRTDGKSVTYHGNTIAKHEGDEVHVTTAGHGHSPSTRGHINGILSRLGSDKLSVKKGQLHHGKNPVDSDAWIKVKKPQKATFSEAAYSAKAGAAGKDLGKPGKNFEKIAAKSGGGEKGNRIAGAILKKIRAKHMKEDQSF